MKISESILEKYWRGEASLAEMMQIELSALVDEDLKERLIAHERYVRMTEKEDHLPLRRKAANSEDNMCVIQCERHILENIFPGYRQRTKLSGPKEDFAYLSGLSEADDTIWKTENGTTIYNIGRIVEMNGLSTMRHNFRDSKELIESLGDAKGLIAVVNEDRLIGREGSDQPDHAVCVLSADTEKVILYNPSTGNEEDDYPLADFMDAWKTSKFYAVLVNTPESKTYHPHPSELLDEVKLDGDLLELMETMAENSHDIWAEARFAQGYVWGEENNSDKKNGKPLTNKDLLPYSQLPESEKDYDRRMCEGNLKLVKYLGYSIIGTKYRCPECGEPIALEWSFCPHCGRELQLDDFKKIHED